MDSLNSHWFGEYSLLVRGNVMAASTDPPGKKMCFSKDNGQTWTYYNLETAGLPWGLGRLNDLLYVGNYLLAATQNGIYQSENDGTDWTDWNTGLLHDNMIDIEVHNGHIWAATAGDGIWKRPLNQLLMEHAHDRDFSDAVLTDFSILPERLNFTPNPASHLIRVETGGQYGDLILQDATGRVVLRQTVVNPDTAFSVEGLPQGFYQVVFIGEKTIRYGSLVVQR
ncbi:MAG: hypothetical protein Q7T20_05340 [Saprospiraceae bacterium]|nr:hypothetical protein [Saprospiraceae bacterium]